MMYDGRDWPCLHLRVLRSVQFVDAEGRVFGPYTKMSTSYDLINYKTPNIAAGPRPPFLAPSPYSQRWGIIKIMVHNILYLYMHQTDVI